MRSPSSLVSIPVVLLVLFAPVVSGQSWLDKVKKKVEQKSAQRADQKTDEAIDKGLDSAEDAMKCVASDQACLDKAKKKGKKVVLVDEQGTPLPEDQQPGGAAATPAGGTKQGAEPGPVGPMQGVWANFDFVPGNRVIFADDFVQDTVGDFPRRLGFESGNWEIVEWQGARFLRSEGHGGAWISINLPELLPERWTFEMDFIFGHPADQRGQAGIQVSFEKDHAGHLANMFALRPDSASLLGGAEGAPHTQSGLTNLNDNRPNKMMLLADGSYVKFYVNDRRIANVPNAQLLKSNKIWINTFFAEEPYYVYVGNFRVAASDKKIYDAFAVTGRLALQGIYFDTGSDKLRPESSGTLKEIGQMLKDHPDLRLLIEGHTDNVGSEASNQVLSEKRAAAVKQSLVANFGIDAGRLESKGFGASKPAAPNDTPEGRQTNRRVEIVKL